jgi:hypothetical protein
LKFISYLIFLFSFLQSIQALRGQVFSCLVIQNLLFLKKYKFSKSAKKGFQAVHNPKEIQAMLDLMLRLQLEHYSLTQDDSLLEDSCMLEINASSNPVAAKSAIHLNSLMKVNTCFSQFVIYYLSIQLGFDNWYSLAAQGRISFVLLIVSLIWFITIAYFFYSLICYRYSISL